MHGPGQVAVQEFDGDQVQHNAEGAGEVVLGYPGGAGVVLHRHLHHPGTLHLAKHRDEAVHLAVQRQVAGDLPVQHPQGAAHVTRGGTGHLADDPVGDLAGEFADQVGVLPLGALAKYRVVALGMLGQQHRDVGGVILQVAIHGGDQVAGGMVDPGAQRWCLAVIAAQLHHLPARIRRRLRAQNLVGAIPAPIIDDDHLIIGHLRWVGCGPVQQGR